jgi:hypothetical protein
MLVLLALGSLASALRAMEGDSCPEITPGADIADREIVFLGCPEFDPKGADSGKQQYLKSSQSGAEFIRIDSCTFRGISTMGQGAVLWLASSGSIYVLRSSLISIKSSGT